MPKENLTLLLTLLLVAIMIVSILGRVTGFADGA